MVSFKSVSNSWNNFMIGKPLTRQLVFHGLSAVVAYLFLFQHEHFTKSLDQILPHQLNNFFTQTFQPIYHRLCWFMTYYLASPHCGGVLSCRQISANPFMKVMMVIVVLQGLFDLICDGIEEGYVKDLSAPDLLQLGGKNALAGNLFVTNVVAFLICFLVRRGYWKIKGAKNN